MGGQPPPTGRATRLDHENVVVVISDELVTVILNQRTTSEKIIQIRRRTGEVIE